MSKIEWTEKTWNPTVGCSIVSPGCHHCYAMRQAQRNLNMGSDRYAGTVENFRWTGQVNVVPEALEIPKRRKTPTMWFVNSMSDLFHESIGFDIIDQIFDVMRSCEQHTFQVLTKRAERMADYFESRGCCPDNAWMGVSIEDCARLARKAQLLRVPQARVRFISAEPLLEAIDFGLARWNAGGVSERPPGGLSTWWVDSRVNWVIVGGESGPGARATELAWFRQIVADCQTAGVPVFVKQLGSNCTDHKTRHPKGGDPAEWPEDLRVREFPNTARGIAPTESA